MPIISMEGLRLSFSRIWSQTADIVYSQLCDYFIRTIINTISIWKEARHQVKPNTFEAISGNVKASCSERLQNVVKIYSWINIARDINDSERNNLDSVSRSNTNATSMWNRAATSMLETENLNLNLNSLK